MLEEVSEARRGVRDVTRWTSPAGCRILGVRVLQGVAGGDSWTWGGWRVLLEMLQFLVAPWSVIDHGSEKAMTFRRRGQIMERAGAVRTVTVMVLNPLRDERAVTITRWVAGCGLRAGGED